MLELLLVLVVVLWLLGFMGHVAGDLIHVLLVIAAVLVIVRLVQSRR